jgi:hypothetical protein
MHHIPSAPSADASSSVSSDLFHAALAACDQPARNAQNDTVRLG